MLSATQRFAGAEPSSRRVEGKCSLHYERMRPAEHSPRGPFYFLERRHGFAYIVERMTTPTPRSTISARP